MMDRKSFFLLISFKRILSRKIQLHRRRRNLLFFVLKILQSKSLKQNQMLLCRFHNFSTTRRLWMIDCVQDWFQRLWQNRNQPIYQEFWQREFRLQTETFEYIVNLLRPRIEKQNTSICRGNRWNSCRDYMSGQRQQSGLLFTQTKVYGKY